MITLYVSAPYASFRKSFARSFAESYPLPPPATVYGMLLSLVGEHFRRRHEGVKLAFAYRCNQDENRNCGHPCLPRIATTVRKLSRYKYGSLANQTKRETPKPDFIETLCGVEFLCWVDSSQEGTVEDGQPRSELLEERLTGALEKPDSVTRSGVLCLGLSDDAVNEVSLRSSSDGMWHRLLPSDTGSMELPIWVDHVGAADTRWQRFYFEPQASHLTDMPGSDEWRWTEIFDPRTHRRRQS